MTTVTPKRFTLAEFHRLMELGFLTEDDRVELIRGELIEMAAKGTRHSVCNTKLSKELERLLGDRAVVRVQEPVVLLPNSEPEPDVALVRGQADDYLSNHPQPEDIFLLIEVADSSLDYDQSTKLELYAENGIQDYWIVNLVANQLECYSQPYLNEQGKYGDRLKQIALRHESIAIPGFVDLSLDLDKVFPSLRNQK
ncbi:Uma2 family endonuclease [Scytonema sp. NUACC26]|uniref:Uma2 family endonuclease n=1 Tax=Scytonema sp. NUACC26 TaxID=3140176 RepID=UPI0034DC4306